MVKLGLNAFFVFLLVGVFLVNFGSAQLYSESFVPATNQTVVNVAQSIIAIVNVTIDGVLQNFGINYTFNSTSIIFNNSVNVYDLIVTHTLGTPDASGNYFLNGQIDGINAYQRADTAYWITGWDTQIEGILWTLAEAYTSSSLTGTYNSYPTPGFGYEEVSLYPQKSVVINYLSASLTDCGNLNVANTVYTLQNDVSTRGTCFNITTDNVTLDGNGYTLTFDTGFIDNSVGIYVYGPRNNITIKNFNNGIFAVANGTFLGSNNIKGIYADSTLSNSIFFNNLISLSTSSSFPFSFGSTYGILISNSSLSNFTNNQISDSMGYSFIIGVSYLNYFYNNSFDSFSRAGFSSSTLDFFSGNHFGSTGLGWAALSFDSILNSTFFDNTLSSLGNTLEAGSSLYNNFSRNGISSTSGQSSYFTSSSFDIFFNNSFGGDTEGVYFTDANSLIFLENNIVSGTGDGLVFNSVNNSVLENNYIDKHWGQETHGGDASINFITSPENTTLLYKNSQGQVKYSDFTASIYSDLLWGLEGWVGLIIVNNLASINSTTIPELNISANITLYNLPTNMNLPQIMKDGVVCTDCYASTSLNNGDVSFNVSSGGNYTIQDNYIAPIVVSSSSSGGGGGGGVSSVGEFGTNFVLALLGSQSFILGGETHSIQFMSVSNGVYTFEIRSNPVVVSLLLGESKLVQVNGSLVNVSLYKTIGNTVYVSMKKIMDSSTNQLINVIPYSNNTASAENLTNTPDDGDSTTSRVFYLGNKIVNSLLMLIIAILVIFIIVLRFKKLDYAFSSKKN